MKDILLEKISSLGTKDNSELFGKVINYIDNYLYLQQEIRKGMQDVKSNNVIELNMKEFVDSV